MATTQTKATRKRRLPVPAEPAHRLLARRLDLLAGIELQHGHAAAAETLAWRAAALREAGRPR